MTGGRKARRNTAVELDRERGRNRGRFRKTWPCEACGKPAGLDYCSDPETLERGPYGLTLCERKACCARREGLTVEQRIELYRATVEASD